MKTLFHLEGVYKGVFHIPYFIGFFAPIFAKRAGLLPTV